MISYDETLAELREVLNPTQMARLILHYNQTSVRAQFDDTFEMKVCLIGPWLSLKISAAKSRWISISS